MLTLFADENRRNPFPLYEQLRTASPVLAIPHLDLWMVFDYDSVKRALNDHASFSSSMFVAGRGNPDWFFFADPPRHTKLRALITRAFTPASVAALEPRIRELACDLLDRAIASGEMDMAADLAVPLPMLVIAEMLGLPAADQPRLHRWSTVMMNLSYAVTGGTSQHEAVTQAWYAATEEMKGYLALLLEERRSSPRNDLLTRLTQAEVDNERLTDYEILGFFQLLLVAGAETTTNLLNNAIICFSEHPGELARLRAAPELMSSAIEEVLRYRSPVQWFFRATTKPVELHGETIPAGKLVLPLIGSANRDPKYFAHPQRFDVARDPNPHIAFGHGIHFCIGAALARLEAHIALPEFLARVEAFEITGGPWEPRKALHVHGPVQLPLRLEPAKRTGTAGSARS